ncbi:hypothetical protein [Bradyrhizobium sp. USDA 4486]
MLVSTFPALQLIYDTAPIGLACLSPDCRYLLINQRLTEICGISVDQIVRSIMETGDPVIGIEVAGRPPARTDRTSDRQRLDYCVVNSTVAIATERLTAETVATVDNTPIRRSAMAKTMMMGVAVISPICASLMASLAAPWEA